MAKLLKLRRGTTSQHGSFTGAEGEVTIDTSKDTAVVHDGSTAGGTPLAKEDMSNVSSSNIAGRLSNDSIATSKIAAGALPSDVTVASANLVDGTIVNADIASNAAIAGTKLENSGVTAGSYGSSSAIPIVTVDAQGLVTAASTTSIDSTRIDNGTSNVRVNNNGNIVTTRSGTDRFTVTNSGVAVVGNLTTTDNITVTSAAPKIFLVDSDTNDDFSINGDGGTFRIKSETDSANRFVVNSDGHIDIPGNLDVGAGIDVTGTIEATGNLDIDGQIQVGSADTFLKQNQLRSNAPGAMFIDHGTTGQDINFRTSNSSALDTTALTVKANGNVDFANGIDVTGNITATGTVDGVDVAASDTLMRSVVASTGNLNNGVTATTQSASDNSTKVATTAYTDTAIANLVDSSPGALNTLNELAAAINDDASFSTTVNNNIATKMPLSGGEFTGDVTCHNITPDGDSSRNLGTNSVRFANVYADNFVGGGGNLTGIVSFVSGMIIMYNSTSAPSGWYLCNGQNGTPDLRDRFIVGAGNSYSQNATGGSVTATDSVSISGSDTVNISISGSGTTGNPNQSGIQYGRPGYSDCARSSHTHNFSFSGSGSDTVSISGSDTVSIDTRSPYYALTFIMKA